MSNIPPPSGAPLGPPPAQGGYSGGPSGVATSSGGIFSPTFMMNNAQPPAGWQPKSKMTAGLLAILIGSLGVHAFYLGNTKKGIFILLSWIVCLAGVWALIDGIMILTGKEQTDAYGVPLTD